MRLTDPVVPDQPLNEVASSKSISAVSKDLFTAARLERRKGSRRSGDHTLRLKVPPIIAGEMTEQTPDDSRREPTSLGEDDDDRTTHLESQLRLRDDSFRYLENNLMEVSFSGKVFIKQGTIYSYSGNLTFWVKPQREEGMPSLVIVSGTGRLLLTDRGREITVVQVNGEEIFVEPSHLLACQETLTPRYAVIEREGRAPTPIARALCPRNRPGGSFGKHQAIGTGGHARLSGERLERQRDLVVGRPHARDRRGRGARRAHVAPFQDIAQYPAGRHRQSDDGENNSVGMLGSVDSGNLSVWRPERHSKPIRSRTIPRPLRRIVV